MEWAGALTVEFFTKLQLDFLENEVAESVDNRDEYESDLKLIFAEQTSDSVRIEAEIRVHSAVKAHGYWIGTGDLLTMEKFYVAKALV